MRAVGDDVSVVREHSESGSEAVTVDVDRLIVDGVPGLYRYLLRLAGGDRGAAEDLVQETCLALVRAVQEDPSADLTVGWMIVVGRRRFLDRLRRERRESARLERVGATEDVDEPDWSLVEGGVALDGLAQLPAAQRAALVFRYVDDLSTAEVAALLDRSVPATESLLARARRELARIVGEDRDGH